MKVWIGRWLVVVATIHTAFAVAVFGGTRTGLVRRGLLDTVGSDPLTGAVVWFVLFGGVLAIAGLAISALERSAAGNVPKSLGWSLLALCVLGVVLMPASGFWLAFPPALAILLRKPRDRAAA